MRDYGKVHTSYWTSSNIRAMSEDGRALAMYLLTCPHGTIAGVFRLPDGYACEDLQWDIQRVHKGFAELFENGFSIRCETTKWVFIKKHFEWNPPENPNQVKAILKVAAQVPDKCSWIPEYMRVCEILGIAKNEPLPNPSETVSESGTGTGTVAGTVAGAEAGTSIGADKPRKPATKPAPLPADFYPNETGVEYAEKRNVTLAVELESFRNWHQAKGTTMKDWQAAWRTWCDKAVEFGRAGQSGGNGARASPRDVRDAEGKRVIEVLTGARRNERSERDITGEVVRLAG